MISWLINEKTSVANAKKLYRSKQYILKFVWENWFSNLALTQEWFLKHQTTLRLKWYFTRKFCSPFARVIQAILPAKGRPHMQGRCRSFMVVTLHFIVKVLRVFYYYYYRHFILRVSWKWKKADTTNSNPCQLWENILRTKQLGKLILKHEEMRNDDLSLTKWCTWRSHQSNWSHRFNNLALFFPR